MGVRRAVETAYKALDEHPDKRVWTLGPLIHNKITLESLSKRGVNVLKEEDIKSLGKNDVVIIRAHGVSPKIKNSLSVQGCITIDATCPRVMRNQKQASTLALDDFTVFIAGDKNHGEVTGIAGCAIDKNGNNKSILIGNRSDAEAFILQYKNNSITFPSKAVLISQTTISPTEFNAIAEVLKKEIPELQVFDTICPATKERQDALRNLKNQVEGVLIIGGKNSANTQRLLMTAQNLFEHATLIETADEIPDIFFTLKSVGLSAGASTPDEVIDSVEKRLTYINQQ